MGNFHEVVGKLRRLGCVPLRSSTHRRNFLCSGHHFGSWPHTHRVHAYMTTDERESLAVEKFMAPYPVESAPVKGAGVHRAAN